jgi:ABC-type transport system involved in cytochrome bd biosynthesis fused ATPase/permease subunit
LNVLSNPLAMASHVAAIAAFSLSWLTSPLAIVIVVSLVVGLLMVVLFGYTSDQKAIGIAKDQL